MLDWGEQQESAPAIVDKRKARLLALPADPGEIVGGDSASGFLALELAVTRSRRGPRTTVFQPSGRRYAISGGWPCVSTRECHDDPK